MRLPVLMLACLFPCIVYAQDERAWNPDDFPPVGQPKVPERREQLDPRLTNLIKETCFPDRGQMKLLKQNFRSSDSVKTLEESIYKTRIKAMNDIGMLGKSAAPAAESLCESISESNEQLRNAALEALEQVRPDLHTHLFIIAVDGKKENVANAIEKLGDMGAKAKPAIVVLLLRIDRYGYEPETNLFGYPREVNSKGEACATSFNALNKILGADSSRLLAFFSERASPSPTNELALYATAPRMNRSDAVKYLLNWAGKDLARRKEVAPYLVAAFDDALFPEFWIDRVADYGVLCKNAAPRLRKIKFNPDEKVRAAAAAAIVKIADK